MLIDQIKARMFQAIKSGAHVEKEILRVAVGEISTEAARPGRQGNDEEALAILRKLLKSNEETLASTTDADKRAVPGSRDGNPGHLFAEEPERRRDRAGARASGPSNQGRGQ